MPSNASAISSYHRYAGKALPGQTGDSCHLLAWHSLDVATCAAAQAAQKIDDVHRGHGDLCAAAQAVRGSAHDLSESLQMRSLESRQETRAKKSPPGDGGRVRDHSREH